MSHPSRFYAAPNFLKMGIKMPRFVVFWTTSTIKDEISGGRGRPLGIFFGFYKTRHILLSNSATCCRFDTIPACDGETDRQTDRRTDGWTDRQNCCS